jgi:hypothetical protein
MRSWGVESLSLKSKTSTILVIGRSSDVHTVLYALNGFDSPTGPYQQAYICSLLRSVVCPLQSTFTG